MIVSLLCFYLIDIDNEGKRSLKIDMRTQESELKTESDTKAYLENKDVHDRLYKQSYQISAKRKNNAKKIDQERGIVFRPKIIDYPVDQNKRKPLYIPKTPSRASKKKLQQ